MVVEEGENQWWTKLERVVDKATTANGRSAAVNEADEGSGQGFRSWRMKQMDCNDGWSI